jgi:putative SOS response-associated peptidase YedK
MCGRFTHLYKWRQLHRLLALLTPEDQIPIRYNVAPSQTAPVVVHDPALGGHALRMMRWGLVPSWAKDEGIGGSLVNARAEGIEGKPSFRAAFKRRRCLVPISGFYEWQKVEGSRAKRPHYIAPADGEPWLVAGLWEVWNAPDGSALESFTIVTTEPNALMAGLHNRMPVILSADDARRWTHPDSVDAAVLAGLLRPCPDAGMVATPVSTVVNSPRHDSADCIRPADREDFGGIFDQSS